jgi:sugar O-acyltransferase (sialic acid O-acetyltransferase NeuD family)
MPKVVILGAGGHARETLGIFAEAQFTGPGNHPGAGEWDVLGFVDEDPAKHGLLLDGKPILGGFSWFTDPDGWQRQAGGHGAGQDWGLRVICAVGSGPRRRRLVNRARALGLAFCSAVSPRATVSPLATIGVGSMIAPGGVVGPQVRLGEHVIVNVGCTISHESRLGDYCTLAPGVHIAGNTQLGDGCDLGIGTVTIQGITVGDWSIVGAGCVLIEDVPPNVTVVGVPARVIKSREDGWYER